MNSIWKKKGKVEKDTVGVREYFDYFDCQTEKKQIRTHLVHSFTRVPVEKGLAAEHDGELLGDALPGLLDGGGIANKGCGHLEPLGGDVTDGGLDIVGDPLDKVRGVLVDS